MSLGAAGYDYLTLSRTHLVAYLSDYSLPSAWCTKTPSFASLSATWRKGPCTVDETLFFREKKALLSLLSYTPNETHARVGTSHNSEHCLSA